MDRINVNKSQPLNQQLPTNPAPAADDGPAYPVFKADQFQRVRPRTAEQASGMKAFDTAALISVISGTVGLMGGLGMAAGILSGAIGGVAIAAAAALIGGAGLLALFLGASRYFSRKKLLEEG